MPEIQSLGKYNKVLDFDKHLKRTLKTIPINFDFFKRHLEWCSVCATSIPFGQELHDEAEECSVPPPPLSFGHLWVISLVQWLTFQMDYIIILAPHHCLFISYSLTLPGGSKYSISKRNKKRSRRTKKKKREKERKKYCYERIWQKDEFKKKFALHTVTILRIRRKIEVISGFGARFCQLGSTSPVPV